MKIAMVGEEIVCADTGFYYERLLGTGAFRWDRKTKTMRGRLCLDTLDALASCCQLTPSLREKREELRGLQRALEEQRTSKNPKPLWDYPIKNAKLMAHQIAGANMALLLFGVVGVGGKK